VLLPRRADRRIPPRGTPRPPGEPPRPEGPDRGLQRGRALLDAGCWGAILASSSADDVAVTPAQKIPTSIAQRSRWARRIALVGVGQFVDDAWLRLPAELELTGSGDADVAHPLGLPGPPPGNASPSTRRLTGRLRHCPVARPRTRRTREPRTLRPNRVRSATKRLKRWTANQPGFRQWAMGLRRAPVEVLPDQGQAGAAPKAERQRSLGPCGERRPRVRRHAKDDGANERSRRFAPAVT